MTDDEAITEELLVNVAWIELDNDETEERMEEMTLDAVALADAVSVPVGTDTTDEMTE